MATQILQCPECGGGWLKKLSPGKLKCGICGALAKTGHDGKAKRLFDWTQKPKGRRGT
jgi:uncharacterized Zn finger protein (UPF0148 family)